MIGILEKLRFLEEYYRSTRGVGHTKAMVRGVQNVDDVAVLLPTQRIAEVLVKKRKSEGPIGYLA